MASALEGFIEQECDDQLAGRLRAEIAAAQGRGYDHFEFNLFNVELFYADDRVTVTQAVPLGYEDADVTVAEFLAAIPDASTTERMPRPSRRAIIPPPPADT